MHILTESDKLRIQENYAECKGNILNLKEIMRLKKKKQNSNKQLEQIHRDITNMQDYISNVCCNYNIKYRKSLSKEDSEFNDNMSNLFSLNSSQINDLEMSIPNLNTLDETEDKIDNNRISLTILNDEIKVNVDKDEEVDIDRIEEKIINKKETVKKIIETSHMMIENDKNMKELEEQIKNDYALECLQLRDKLQNIQAKLKHYENANHSLNNSVNELMSELEKANLMRKNLHNFIQQLRGNIRVYCRVKPLTDVVNFFKFRILILLLDHVSDILNIVKLMRV
jgi:kinesin family protein C1